MSHRCLYLRKIVNTSTLSNPSSKMTPVFQLKYKSNFNQPSTVQIELCMNADSKNDPREKEENESLQDSRSIQDCSNTVVNQIYVNIHSVTAGFNLKTYVNLRYIAQNGYNVEYKREKGKLLMRLRKPQIVANIWSSGKVICVGALSEYEAKIASKRIARIIQKLGYHDVMFNRFKIIGVMATCVLPFSIRLIPFAKAYRSNVQYEPELNPGLTYKIKELKASMNIFSTGSITIHAPSELLVKQAIEHVYPLILPFGWEKVSASVKCLTAQRLYGTNEKVQKKTIISTGDKLYLRTLRYHECTEMMN